MGTKIQLRRGNKADLPTLDNGELGFVQDTTELYVGTPTGNEKLTFDQTKYDSYDAQLAEKVSQTALNTTNSNVSLKADKTYTDTELSKKRDRTVKLEPEDLSANTLALVTGQSAVNLLSVPQAYSVDYSKLSSEMIDITHELLGVGSFEIGTLASATGLPSANTTRVRVINYISTKKGFLRFINDGFAEYGLFFYNKDTFQLLSSTTWLTEPYYKIPYEDCLTKVILRKPDSSTITVGEESIFASKVQFYGLKSPSKSISYDKLSDGLIGVSHKNSATVEGFEVGTLDATTGDIKISSTRIRTKSYLMGGKSFIRFVNNGIYEYGVFFYNKDNFAKIDSTPWLRAEYYEIPYEDCLVKVIIRKITEGTVTTGEIATILANFSLYTLKEIISNKLTGLKWGVIGASIVTEGYLGTGQYPKKISDRNGMTLQNLAIPGSLITKSNKSGHADTHMCERVLLLDDDCDIVTVSDGGTNDMRYPVPLGTMGSTDITTFYGAVDLLCRNLITKFPNKPKGIITPIKFRGRNNELAIYVNAYKEVTDYYGIPKLDFFTSCDLQPDIDFINQTYFFEQDGAHPNSLGHDILVPKVENFLNSLVI